LTGSKVKRKKWRKKNRKLLIAKRRKNQEEQKEFDQLCFELTGKPNRRKYY
jgi:hypothetical protein